MDLEPIVKIIGSFVVTAILFAIPILTTCAFVLHWDGFWQFLFVIFSMAEFITLLGAITEYIDK